MYQYVYEVTGFLLDWDSDTYQEERRNWYCRKIADGIQQSDLLLLQDPVCLAN